jgi:hypothetical protein
VYAAYKLPPETLYAVSASFVQRLSRINIFVYLTLGHIVECDPGHAAERFDAITEHDRYSGIYLMRAAGQKPEHARRVFFIRRLSEYLFSKNNYRIRADYQRAGVRFGDIYRFVRCKLFYDTAGKSKDILCNFTGYHLERRGYIRKKLFPPRGGGCEYYSWLFIHYTLNALIP